MQRQVYRMQQAQHSMQYANTAYSVQPALYSIEYAVHCTQQCYSIHNTTCYVITGHHSVPQPGKIRCQGVRCIGGLDAVERQGHRARHY